MRPDLGVRAGAVGIAFLCTGAKDSRIWDLLGTSRDPGAFRSLPKLVWMLLRAFGEALRCNLEVGNLSYLHTRELETSQWPLEWSPTRLAFNLLTLPAASSRASQPQAGAAARDERHRMC